MITIFTPAYNRAYIIHRLYESLKRQTNQNFEWIIVDDGSTDNLSELAAKWAEEAKFPVRYQYTKNGGKHRAINLGVQLAACEAFFIVDSDDYLTDDAVELVHQWWQAIGDDESYAGVSGLRATEQREIIGGAPTFQTFVDATNLEREKYGLLGDKAEVSKTAVLEKYPFPEFGGENFLTEGVAILSMLETKKSETQYKFFVVVSDKINRECLKYLERLAELRSDFSYQVIFINSSIFDGQKITTVHLTTSAYYRLILADVLKDYDKCMYHDGDILVNVDLQDMFDVDMDGCYVAKVKDILRHQETTKRDWRYLKKALEPYQGVMIFGYSKIGRKVFDTVSRWGHQIPCLIDNDQKKQGQRYEACEVLAPVAAVAGFPEAVIVNTSQRFAHEIRKQLMDMGVPAERIIDYSDKSARYYLSLDPQYYDEELRDMFVKELG